MRISIGNCQIENFRVLFLDKKYRLLQDYLQETGTIDQTPIYIREIIKMALALGASAVIISHNHPSQECKPSDADLKMTSKLQQACANVGVELIDHIIVTSVRHFSFASNGLL